MAITVAAANTGNSTTSGRQLTVTAGVAFAVNDFIVVVVAADNNGTNGATSTVGCADAVGNYYTLRCDQLRDPGVAAAGVSLRAWTAPIVFPLATTDQIVVSFSPNTAAKAVAIWRVTPTAGSAISFIAETGGAAATANPTVTSASITSGNLVIGANGVENTAAPTADSDTSNGNWSTAQAPVAT